MIEKKHDASYILSKKNIFFIILAFAIVSFFYFLPEQSGLSHAGQIMIGILLMGAVLWITEPIPLAVTGLLIMIMQPLLGVVSAQEVFASFGSQAVFFLIGAFIIAGAIEKHGLHKRFALRLLSYFKNNPRFFTLGVMISCALLSFIIPEHAVAALFLPIVISILIAVKVIPKQSNFGKSSVLAVAFGCSIGSLGTLVGGARNPLTIGFLSSLDPPITISFFSWMIYAMPVVFLSLPLVWIVLQLVFPVEKIDISEAKKEIEKQVREAGNMNKQEYKVLFVLILTVCLWLFFSSPEYLGLAVIAIVGSILLFFMGCISWKDVEERVPWGIILLYGGAITLGIGMQKTGAGSWLARQLFQNIGANPYLVIFLLIVFTVLLTNSMSNVGAVAILLPFGLAIAGEIPGISSLFASMLIALSGGLAFMLIIATPGNAITYSSGFYSTRDLFKAGSIASGIGILVIFLVAIFYWRGVLGL